MIRYAYTEWVGDWAGGTESVVQRPADVVGDETEGLAVHTVGCGCCSDTIVVTRINRDKILAELREQLAYVQNMIDQIEGGS